MLTTPSRISEQTCLRLHIKSLLRRSTTGFCLLNNGLHLNLSQVWSHCFFNPLSKPFEALAESITSISVVGRSEYTCSSLYTFMHCVTFELLTLRTISFIECYIVVYTWIGVMRQKNEMLDNDPSEHILSKLRLSQVWNRCASNKSYNSQVMIPQLPQLSTCEPQ